MGSLLEDFGLRTYHVWRREGRRLTFGAKHGKGRGGACLRRGYGSVWFGGEVGHEVRCDKRRLGLCYVWAREWKRDNKVMVELGGGHGCVSVCDKGEPSLLDVTLLTWLGQV
ncbi:hypothetical protein PIB30_059396 [Stylosanthes scabra]|uniref:Uncharacterized protein n=1 Tax=Stylosanthes scabra TaxID=79078 RepID=A0ABU6UJ09_9FABA|nr:hypothetical protein [Stylosanthes scabra]